MNNSYWLEIELWKIQQNRLNQLHKLEVIEKSKSQFMARLIVQIGNMMVSMGQYLQTIAQPSHYQTMNYSNL